jgi:predicted RNA-binding Zn-ribbon protein involved in translation (DUF1610 family)
MLSMRRQITISIGELRYVSIACPHCGTAVTLDMTKPSELSTRYGSLVPARCPACDTDYDSAIKPGVGQFCDAYKALKPIEQRVSFALDVKDTDV